MFSAGRLSKDELHNREPEPRLNEYKNRFRGSRDASGEYPIIFDDWILYTRKPCKRRGRKVNIWGEVSVGILETAEKKKVAGTTLRRYFSSDTYLVL